MDRVRERSILRAIGVGVGAMAAVGGVLSAAGWATGTSIDLGGGIPVLAGMMLGGFMVVSSHRPRAYIRAILKQGLCPNCAMVLNASARVEFDGCVSCEHCGRAWMALDVQEPVPEVKPRDRWAEATLAREGRGDE